MPSGMKLIGKEEMQKKLSRLAVQFPKVVMAALYQEAQIDMTEAKKRTPVDKGPLRASGHVLKPVQEGSMISVDLVYGGAAEAYAIRQHEELDYHHTVGQAKFLESVIMETAPNLRSRLAARIQFNEVVLR